MFANPSSFYFEAERTNYEKIVSGLMVCLLSAVLCMIAFAQECKVLVLPISDSGKTVKFPVGNAEILQMFQRGRLN